MKVNTFTVVVGTKACNARCPFCVSRMTPGCDVPTIKTYEPNTRNFLIAGRFALQVGATTALLTGKGEPTLFCSDINYYVVALKEMGYQLIELQTNGKVFYHHPGMLDIAKRWYRDGMTCISISVVHYRPEKNNQIMFGRSYNDKEYYDFWEVVHDLKRIGFMIRLNCTLMVTGIDSVQKVAEFIERAKNHDVDQITLRGVAKPDESEDPEAARWVEKYQWKKCEQDIGDWLIYKGATSLLELDHGARIYDFHGQNVCINNCLTSNKNPEHIRQLIFFPDGHLRYDWKYPGALIL